MRGLGHRNLLPEASWVLLLSLFGLSGRGIGQTYNGFSYSVSGTDITITGYTGSGAATIPSSIPGVDGTVTSIGGSAFQRIAGLTSVTIPGSVTSIGSSAFWACTGLTSATIPSSVTSIGAYAFGLCYSLTKVTIPSGVTEIQDAAFEGCEGLTSVTIPGSVTSIGYQAFWQCGGLTVAYFQGNAPPSFGSMVFDGEAPGFLIWYPRTATGWSTPTWMGYHAQPYAYTPATPRPLLALTLGSGAVTPSFNNLQLGTNYQLQVSTDLSTWSNTGPVFTATNASEAYAQPFDVTNWNRLFLRLQSAP